MRIISEKQLCYRCKPTRMFDLRKDYVEHVKHYHPDAIELQKEEKP